MLQLHFLELLKALGLALEHRQIGCGLGGVRALLVDLNQQSLMFAYLVGGSTVALGVVGGLRYSFLETLDLRLQIVLNLR